MTIRPGVRVIIVWYNKGSDSVLVETAVNFGTEDNPDWHITGFSTDTKKPVSYNQRADNITMITAVSP